jgi:hypothetical protein
LIAPVKNENLEVILFILNFDELNEQLDSNSKRFSKRNQLLQQIGMPFISSIFTRNPVPSKNSRRNSNKINDPFSFLDQKAPKRSSSVINLNQSSILNKPSLLLCVVLAYFK